MFYSMNSSIDRRGSVVDVAGCRSITTSNTMYNGAMPLASGYAVYLAYLQFNTLVINITSRLWISFLYVYILAGLGDVVLPGLKRHHKHDIFNLIV